MPLTLNQDALVGLLRQIDFGMVEDGTAIGMGLATAVNRLRRSPAKSKVVILMTDGINNRGAIDPLTAAELARAVGVRVYTIGVGTTGHVHRLLEALGRKGIGTHRVAVHFHDTYGQALANTMAALRDGVTVVDASTGGLGGCPYAKSATGNLATEDLVWALTGAGVETGVDLDKLVETSVWMAQQLGRPSPSNVVRALAG